MKSRNFSLDGNQLKLIAVVFMIFDHIYSYLLLDVLPAWCSLIARFVAPLFVFMLVEGFFHTSSRKRHLIRIIEAAAITWIGEIIINFAFHNVDPLTHKMTIYSLLEGNNILVTLAIYLGIMWALELFRENKKRWYYLLLALVLMVISLMFEGRLYLLPVLLIFYFAYHKPAIESIGIFIWCLLLFIKAVMNANNPGVSLYSSLTFDSEWM
ncbi:MULTISPECIES: TraX family protein [Lactobacillus]|uniref:TraX protein n=1 Tax=Lactobacillus xujianguonis TaxID=2495899 RepID=A0A437SVP7_9LACO|nr:MULTISPECIES: TraX family protein [Lactobacillus]RVU70995.1 hypothetical protein EJK17_04635 [Lactobacillus xujianguonis]RVU73935.1 hypothetical protein EJK20_05675 [Lactobacillus xujianguonis]